MGGNIGTKMHDLIPSPQTFSGPVSILALDGIRTLYGEGPRILVLGISRKLAAATFVGNPDINDEDMGTNVGPIGVDAALERLKNGSLASIEYKGLFIHC